MKRLGLLVLLPLAACETMSHGFREPRPPPLPDLVGAEAPPALEALVLPVTYGDAVPAEAVEAETATPEPVQRPRGRRRGGAHRQGVLPLGAFETQSLGTPVTRPGHAFGLPGHAFGRPGHAFGRPGHAVGRPGRPVGRPGHAVGLPAHPVRRPAHAVRRAGHGVERPAHPIRRSGNAVIRPAHPIRPPAAPILRPSAPIRR